MTERASTLVTMLFTDLVGSTELLARAGDEDAQRIFRAHHDLLAETAAAHGGQEVKWLGDGLMVAFPSAADAVTSAIAMQQASRRPVAGERLGIRVGLNAGEAMRDSADWFGLPVVIARRLCDSAAAGQILCSDLVTGLLGGRAGFSFAELGQRELKGVPFPVGAFEVRYEAAAGAVLPSRFPFVGRQQELARLVALFGDAMAGRGGLVLLAGEPGIGKTRLTEELSERACHDGASVLWGRCFEGDWAPPYGPFAEAVETLASTIAPEELRADLGTGAAPLAQLVPALRTVLPDLPEAAPIQPDEERFRLLDSLAQLLAARSRRAPLLLCLDDLHWADASAVAALRQVARLAPRHRLLIVGTYRDAEVDADHPLSEALGQLRREVEYERLKLDGLEAKAVNQLLEALADHDVIGAVAAAIATETDGNPFFIREVLRHLVEEGTFARDDDGRWMTNRPLAELGIPDGVREVIDRRLARLSPTARKLLAAASAFEGPFGFDVIGQVSGLDEDAALDALDEGLAAQLLAPAEGIDTYAFTHAVIRHTLTSALSPSRRMRLHLRVAQSLQAAAGGSYSAAQAGEIAAQYHRAAGLPGSEEGVEPALVAADHAEATGANTGAAHFLRAALDLLPADDVRRTGVTARLGMTLAWALRFDEAVEVAGDAGATIAAAEGGDAAAEYLGEAAYACANAGSGPHAWALARTGLRHAVSRNSVAWARLVSFDHERQSAEHPDHPGIPLESSERAEAARILRDARLDPLGPAPMEAVFDSRDDALRSHNLIIVAVWGGEFAGSAPRLRAEADAALARGQLARAARALFIAAYCWTALGDFDTARETLQEAKELIDRLGIPMFAWIESASRLALALDEPNAELVAVSESLVERPHPAAAWGLGWIYGNCAVFAARDGRADEALRFQRLLLPWLERAPAWTIALPVMAHSAAEVLWYLERLDHVDVVEQALRTKVIVPDFRGPMADGRLALARLCALTGRHAEAAQWFAEARFTLTEQQARPLLAIADFDEALMYARRSDAGDADLARPLLKAARRQFEDIGMTGWIRRADQLEAQLA